MSLSGLAAKQEKAGVKGMAQGPALRDSYIGNWENENAW